MQTLERDKQLISYLLGELPEAQREELEERFCHDADLFEQMLALRDDLIDDYLRGEFSTQGRQFERYFLATPQQRERVENARALMRVIAAEPMTEMPALAQIEAEPISWWQRLGVLLRGNQRVVGVAFAIALIIIVVTGSLIFEMVQLRNQLTLAQQQQQKMQQRIVEEGSRADRLNEELANARKQDDLPPSETSQSRPEQNVIASLILTSDYDLGTKGSGGSNGSQKLDIPSNRGLVELQLKLADASYRSYRVTLKEISSGKIVQTLVGLPAQSTRSGKAIIARFPVSSFSGPTKDYLLILDGKTAEGKYETEIDKYSFRANKK